MASGGGTYEIVQGVRRAKAFALAGIQAIRAIIQYDDGTQSPETMIPIDTLRSPHKSEIDMSTNAQADRFWKIWHGVQAGQVDQIPPIVVTPGSKGARVEDIGWAY